MRAAGDFFLMPRRGMLNAGISLIIDDVHRFGAGRF
jgi:hypothetical protein